MSRYFNTAGPANRADHYCLPPLSRFNLDDIERFIAQKKYFVLHAPRQVGKTTCLLALQEYLNQTGQYACLYLNVEVAQAARENIERGIAAILGEMAERAHYELHDSFLTDYYATFSQFGADKALNSALTRWAEQSARPLVVLIDEIDALVGDTLISVLRQLRAGYDKRPRLFPQSVVLCGVRDVRDYRLHSDHGKAVITGGSAFNIKATSLRLGNFSRAEVDALYQQHTQETGQAFTLEAVELVWELTQGQPWLVNALGYEVCFEMPQGRDRSQPVTPKLVMEAKERILLRRETHLDQLADKLREPRVRRVLEPILSGDTSPDIIPTDDIQYVYDLGLIQIQGQLTIANPIYREVIPRELTYSTQLTISQQPVWFIRPDGRLNMEKLLTAFQQFFREHSEHWIERFDYKEAGPQLLLQAFLQRIVNGGGRIEREYGLGRRRTDLLVIWPVGEEMQRVVCELKIVYGALATTIADGLQQTWEYMDRCGATDGHLIIFNRAPALSWEAKIFRQEEHYRERAITVWGM